MGVIRKDYIVGSVDNYVIEYHSTWFCGIEVYVRLHPYDPFKKSPAYHHLYANGLLCIAAEHRPGTVAQAERIARAWMETYSNYVRTGYFPTR
ncbi:MAG: hypothetical protein KDA88_23570 [Planctomycetaceae bacterium]|nr:hypothetical protein [Planctomycetaceae bacterium]MCB9952139.1 hypothetical protein [Planctomycetaceae bacterium]